MKENMGILYDALLNFVVTGKQFVEITSVPARV